MKGRLIVLEGLDGSGKSTQFQKLWKSLEQQGVPVRAISFPDYNEPSSALVRGYLAGEFGGKADAVNPYAASSFYACDRFASYQKQWKPDYEAGKVIVAARYTTSNPIYQMVKLPREEWDGYLSWLIDYEYEKLALPRPDLTIFLDMPLEVSKQLLEGRYHGDQSRKDIHERDEAYLSRCRKAALHTAERWSWSRVCCARNGAPRGIEEIAADVLALTEQCLNHKEMDFK